MKGYVAFDRSGTGDAQDTMRRMSNTYNVKNILNAANPHNQFLCTVLQHGIMGMFVLMALLAIPMKIAWAGREYFVFAFCSLFILTCLTEPVLELQKGIDFFAIFYPLILFHYCPHKLNSIKNKIDLELHHQRSFRHRAEQRMKRFTRLKINSAIFHLHHNIRL